RSRQAVDAAERYADQQIGDEQLLDAQKAAIQAASEQMRAEAHAAASAAAKVVMSPFGVVWQTAWAVVRSRVKDVSRQIAEREVVRKAALADLAALLRDLTGN